MKYLPLVLFFVACTLPFGDNLAGYEILETPLEEAWVRAAAFTAIPDEEGLGYMKSPKEFERDGGGDCEDFAAYMIYLLGPKAAMVTFYIGWAQTFHAAVLWEGEILEPQVVGVRWSGSGSYIVIDYNTVMAIATSQGTKSL